jgi:hypothetical protein
MKTLSVILAIAILVSSIFSAQAAARERTNPGLRPMRAMSETEMTPLADPGLRGLYEEAAVDTYCLVWYDFETLNWQGWTRVDRTGQQGTFFHVDDFAGLGGGDFGGLVPLEGTKSMWCGARPNAGNPYMCSWAKAPGYGNLWDQSLEIGPFAFVGGITLSYKCHYDMEPDHDFVRLQYGLYSDTNMGEEFTGRGDTTISEWLTRPRARFKLRFHFTSDGAWSDEDGLWNTDGAFIIDSIRIRDNGAMDYYEDFESAAVGATSAGFWHGTREASYGTYSGLKSNLRDKDPCGEDMTSLIVFFFGSPHPSTKYPGLYDTPFCYGSGGHEAPCQNELVVSPPIDTRRYSTGCNSIQDGVIPPGELPSLGGFEYRFAVYADLPTSNLVIYQWHVRNIVNGCPGQWLDRNIASWDNRDWVFEAHDVSDLITSDTVQVSLGVVDMCDVWYLVNGNCAQHTPAPWFDNVRLYRYGNSGPQWSYRDLDLFQDNFPGQEFVLESYVRADAANDINTTYNPVIRPGDSIVVDCSSPEGGGIATDPGGGPAVYMHVKCTYIGPAPAKPDLSGPSLQGTYGSYKSDDGVWTIIQGDTARAHGSVYANKYMFDLNDSLFTRGYEIDYYFTARSAAGTETALPKWARSCVPHFEFTCLPTMNSDVLFVDDYSGRGSFAGTVENYWTPIFEYAPGQPNADVDRYDVNGPTSGVSNGPGSRAKTKQLVDQYHAIIWDSGDLWSVTISDGTTNSDKSNDCRMIIDWFEQSEHVCGLWVCGDNVACDLNGLASAPALTLLHTWCGVSLVNLSYFDLTGGRAGGGVVNPLVSGEADAGVFVHEGVPDKFYAYGGCPVINQFDVLEKTAYGKYALSYPVYNTTNRYAAIASSQPNPGGFAVNTMWFGFSFQYIRDDVFASVPDQFEIARDVFDWWQYAMSPGCCYVDAEAPAAFKLAQNYPNPFNPSTTIRFGMKAKGLVTVKIYDVAGRLVRTLVSEVKEAGAYSAVWDGRNNLGAHVASGIYFYKMEAKGFGATKKLVLLR